MARMYGRDIESAILTQLKSATSGLNKILADIDTERTETLYAAEAIKDSNFQSIDFTNYVPGCHVFIEGFQRGNIQELGENAGNMSGDYSVSVIIETKITKAVKLNTILNNYEEALTRCLHLADIAGFSWIKLLTITKGQFQKADKDYYDFIEGKFTVRIN